MSIDFLDILLYKLWNLVYVIFIHVLLDLLFVRLNSILPIFLWVETQSLVHLLIICLCLVLFYFLFCLNLIVKINVVLLLNSSSLIECSKSDFLSFSLHFLVVFKYLSILLCLVNFWFWMIGLNKILLKLCLLCFFALHNNSLLLFNSFHLLVIIISLSLSILDYLFLLNSINLVVPSITRLNHF